MKRFIFTLLSACLLSSAHAQETEPLEEITVTGTRIARDTLTTPAPVTVLDAETIRNTGAVNLGDVLNELPALGSTFGSQNSDRFIGTAGLNLLDLRRLGTARTLVLVNGQRHVAAQIGGAGVDVNSIPAILIDRVEVVTGGASAVYGADAVTGVVNFILRDDFEGTTVTVQGGNSDDGLTRSSGELVTGFNFSEGRGNAVVAIEYSESGDLTAADRGAPPTRTVANPLDGDTTDENGEIVHDGIPDELIMPNAGLSIITNGGWFNVGGTNYVFDAPNSFRLQNLGTDFGSSECGEGCDFLDLTSFVNIVTPQERYAINALVNYQLTGEHYLTLEGKYVNSQAEGFGQPHFNFFNMAIARDNAFLPSGLGEIMDAAEAGSFNLNRFNTDAGLRGQINERQTSRAVVGVSGPFGGLSYDANLVYGRTVSNQQSTFNRINERWFAAVDVVEGPDGNPVCRHTLDPMSINTSLGRALDSTIVGDCVPANVFGEGAVSGESIAYFSTTSNRIAKIEQAVANFSVAGDAVELPWGAIGVAGGLEYRREKSDDRPDAIDTLGLTFLNVLRPETGSYDVSEAFAELSIPLPLRLRADIAGRWSDYSTVGKTFTWKGGLEWAVFDSFTARGTFSEAVRAPNIGELFGPQNQTFFNVLDPCSDDRLDLGRNGRAVREANCRMLGVPAGFDARDEVTRTGLQGGNPDLDAETSESFTVGIVLRPTDSIGFAIDYWDIDIDDAIALAGAQDILNRCVDAPDGIDNEFCNRITRDPTNNISLIVRTSQNIARLEASGYDFEGHYSADLFGGDFSVRAIATLLSENNSFPFQSDPDSKEQEAGGLGDPELSGVVNVGWYRGGLGVNWSARYLDSMLLIDQEDFDVNPDAQDPLFTGGVWYHDVNVAYRLTDWLELSGGVDNIFDERPPAFFLGTGAGSGIFDGVGRFVYLGATASF